MNSQLNATVIILLTISISSTCFGRQFCPKHVELIEITDKLLLLHLVGSEMCHPYCVYK